MKFSVFGGRGFIGSHLVRHLKAQGHEVWVPERGALLEKKSPAGHVIYAIGLTGNFRQRLYDTIDSHVNVLTELLQALSFDSFLYLSSTRVYGGLPPEALASEGTLLNIAPSPDSVYDLSKLLGEAVCLAQPQESVRVARLSNVYGIGQGTDTFLGAVLKEAQHIGHVTIGEAPESSKDYVAVDSVVEALERIALGGKERLYNLASGIPTTHNALMAKIREVTGADVAFDRDAPLRVFPRVDIGLARKELDFSPRSVLEDFAGLFDGRSQNPQGAS